MKRLLSGACALCLVLFDSAYAADVAPAQRPNIILVMADDLGWSDIGCYGGELGTPHIDSLARDGLRFTQFYNNSICGPTRASLLTGLYCQQVGHRGDRWNEPKDFSKCVTVAELLQEAGYRTMMVGKWQGRDLAVDRGFDRFFGPMCQAKISYFHEVEQNPYRLDRDPWETPQEFYLTDAINDFAVEFLEEAVGRDQPFFLYVAHIAPHWPLHAREAMPPAVSGIGLGPMAATTAAEAARVGRHSQRLEAIAAARRRPRLGSGPEQGLAGGTHGRVCSASTGH